MSNPHFHFEKFPNFKSLGSLPFRRSLRKNVRASIVYLSLISGNRYSAVHDDGPDPLPLMNSFVRNFRNLALFSIATCGAPSGRCGTSPLHIGCNFSSQLLVTLSVGSSRPLLFSAFAVLDRYPSLANFTHLLTALVVAPSLSLVLSPCS